MDNKTGTRPATGFGRTVPAMGIGDNGGPLIENSELHPDIDRDTMLCRTRLAFLPRMQRLEATANDACESFPLQASAAALQSSPLPGAGLRMSGAGVAYRTRMDKGCTTMSGERFEEDRPTVRSVSWTLRPQSDP
jgi:hypothetical protein